MKAQVHIIDAGVAVLLFFMLLSILYGFMGSATQYQGYDIVYIERSALAALISNDSECSVMLMPDTISPQCLGVYREAVEQGGVTGYDLTISKMNGIDYTLLKKWTHGSSGSTNENIFIMSRYTLCDQTGLTVCKVVLKVYTTGA